MSSEHTSQARTANRSRCHKARGKVNASFIIAIMGLHSTPPSHASRFSRSKVHLLPLLLAWVLAAVWGSVVQTQWNLQALVNLGVDISTTTRVVTTGQDVLGFAPVYGGLMAAGWLLALPVAAALARWWPRQRTALLGLAAAAGMIAAVRAVDSIAPMPVFIDATRHWPGLLVMALGAAAGGLLYARLTAGR